MEHIRHFGNLTLQNKTMVLKISVLLIFSTVAVWDVALIINDYVNNNRYTLVKLEKVNDTFIYLKNDQAKICLLYGFEIENRRRKFPELSAFINNPQGPVYKDYIDLVTQVFKNGTTLHDLLFDGFNLTLDINAAATAVIKGLQEMDIEMFKRFRKGDEYMSRVPSWFSALDGVLENVSNTEKLVNIWSKRQESMFSIVYPRARSPITQRLPLQDFDALKICVIIPLSSMLTRKQRFLRIFAGNLGNEDFMKNNTKNVSLSMQFADGILHELDITNTTLTEIRLVVSNIAVFEKQSAEECSDELPIYYSNKDPDCWTLVPIQFAKICFCIPFSARLYFHKASSDFQKLPFCSSKMYNGCFKNAVQFFRSRRSCLPPCTFSKNQYLVTSSTRLGFTCMMGENKTDITLCTHAMLDVECNDFYYAVYEERMQFSPSQLLSQIGGDLGLYTGFSLLGVWQFFVLTYTLYQSFRQLHAGLGDALPHGTYANAAKKTVSALLVHYLEDAIETTPPNSSGNQNPEIEILKNQLMVEIKKEQQQFRKEIFDLIAAINNKLNGNQNTQSDVTVCDL